MTVSTDLIDRDPATGSMVPADRAGHERIAKSLK
jgi:hypothetical protein